MIGSGVFCVHSNKAQCPNTRDVHLKTWGESQFSHEAKIEEFKKCFIYLFISKSTFWCLTPKKKFKQIQPPNLPLYVVQLYTFSGMICKK